MRNEKRPETQNPNEMSEMICTRALKANLKEQKRLTARQNKANYDAAVSTVAAKGCIALSNTAVNLLFSKALPHDTHGNVDETEMRKLISALRSMDMKQLNEVKMGGALKLHSPCTTITLGQFGSYKPDPAPPNPPALESDTVGAEMVDLYWRSLVRDVPYAAWSTNSKISKAVRDLNTCDTAYQARPKHGPVTVEGVFRGPPGCASLAKGPLVSQFALLPFRMGTILVPQKHVVSAKAGVNYMVSPDTYLSCQSGTVQETTTATAPSLPRFIQTPRDGAWAVHSDPPASWATHTALILSQLGCPWGPLNPFRPPSIAMPGVGAADVPRVGNEFNFIDMGMNDCFKMISMAVALNLQHVWYVKWSSMHLRPENTGYLVHLAKTGQTDKFKDFPARLSPLILGSKVLRRVYKKQKSYLLSQAFPEGAPLHPSYFCGHCSFAAASLTIVKAMFDTANFHLNVQVPSPDGQTLVPYPSVGPLRTTAEDEINKLIFNVALWRDTAGVHFLSDSLGGIPAGEAAAKSILQDAANTYRFAVGFQYKTVFGETVIVTNFDPCTRFREVSDKVKRIAHTHERHPKRLGYCLGRK